MLAVMDEMLHHAVNARCYGRLNTRPLVFCSVDTGRGWSSKGEHKAGGPTPDLQAPEAAKWQNAALAGSLVECALQVCVCVCV
jgi:hypothetical protein